MGLPTKKHSSSKRDRRRSHLHLVESGLAKCSHCGSRILSHQVCPDCGYYKTRKVIDVFAKLDKKERKKKEKELAAKEKESGKEKPLTPEELTK